MILCSSNPESILKAAILSLLTGQLAELRVAAMEQPNLFTLSDEIDADGYSLSRLICEIASKTGRNYAWLSHYQGRRIAIMSLFNLRNHSRDCSPIIFAALAEALYFGPGYCICGRGAASSVFRRRSREVGSEIHRMMGLIRFDETAEGDLVAFRSAGAYGSVMASEYNTRPLVPEVLVNGDHFAVIRARPSFDEILNRDTIPAWL